MAASRSLSLSFALLLVLSMLGSPAATARSHKHAMRTHHRRSSQRAESTAHRRQSRHHGKTHRRRSAAFLAPRAVAHVRYAYPPNFFMWNAPESLESELSREQQAAAKCDFANGQASSFSPQQLVQAGVFVDDPLRGGIFQRREPVKYIILHSTETGRPAPAPRVIKSWNRGMRHPGAQYIVDRDGTIYQTVDPEYATVHVDIFRTRYSVNNDNSIGIEMVRAGDQQYTQPQLDSVTRLVAYLQSRFHVDDKHIYGHHDVQPSNRLDPVGFDWEAFFDAKQALGHHPTTATVKYMPHPRRVDSSAASTHDVSNVIPEGTPPISFVDAECGNIPQADEDI